MRVSVLFAVIGLFSCNGQADDDGPDDDLPQDVVGTDVPYQTSELLDVQVSMEPSDFDELRVQSRGWFDILGGPGCQDQPFESPFTWLEADVTVGGQSVEQVGVRKKGFLGSLDPFRPSLKLKLDRFVEGQGLGDTERVTLNNNRQDPTRMRTCLAYETFAAAGIPAPRCGFAAVSVNGESLGVYSHVEAVKRRFLKRNFDESDGDLYEGTVSDFTEPWLNTFDAKTDDTDPDGAPLLALTEALAASDAELLASLEPVLDLDAFFRFWAVEVLVGHWDGYASNGNNYFVYFGEDGRGRFIPWGPDASFEQESYVAAQSEVARRLYRIPEGRSRFEAELRDVLDTVWDEAAVLARIDELEALMAPQVLDASNWTSGLVELRASVRERGSFVENMINLGVWSSDVQREQICMSPSGTASWDFDITWGGSGETEVSFVMDGVPGGGLWTVDTGFEDGQPYIGAFDWDGTVTAMRITMDERLFEPGEHRLGLAFTMLLYMEEGERLWLSDGQLVLEETGTELGDRIKGSVTGELYPWY